MFTSSLLLMMSLADAAPVYAAPSATTSAQSAPARPFTPPPTDAAVTYDFAVAVVEGMGQYISVWEDAGTITATGEPVNDVVNLMSYWRTAQTRWRIAANLLRQSRSTSKDEVVRTVATMLADSYLAMAVISQRYIDLLERLMKSPFSMTVADVAIEKSKLNAQMEQMENSIAVATAEVTTALVAFGRTDTKGHSTYLKITTAQKDYISERLFGLAGPSPADTKLDEGRSHARIPAVVIWRWFQGEWLGSDSQ
jgi:hypothetical protein